MSALTIDTSVLAVTKRFGVDSALIQSVVNAEGGPEALIRAVRCSPHMESITTYEQALDVTCRSAVHAMSDYIKANHPGDFVVFWGARWAPVGAKNDPTNLNANWVSNVFKLWRGTNGTPV